MEIDGATVENQSKVWVYRTNRVHFYSLPGFATDLLPAECLSEYHYALIL